MPQRLHYANSLCELVARARPAPLSAAFKTCPTKDFVRPPFVPRLRIRPIRTWKSSSGLLIWARPSLANKLPYAIVLIYRAFQELVLARLSACHTEKSYPTNHMDLACRRSFYLAIPSPFPPASHRLSAKRRHHQKIYDCMRSARSSRSSRRKGYKEASFQF